MGLIVSAVFTWYIPEFQTLQRQAGVQNEPHCVYKQFWHVDPFSTPGMVGTLPKSKFLQTTKGHPGKPAFLRILFRLAMSTLPPRDTGFSLQPCKQLMLISFPPHPMSQGRAKEGTGEATRTLSLCQSRRA